MLRTRRFSFPAADPELLHSFYPFLMNFMLEVQIQDLNEPDGDAFAEGPPSCNGIHGMHCFQEACSADVGFSWLLTKHYASEH